MISSLFFSGLATIPVWAAWIVGIVVGCLMWSRDPKTARILVPTLVVMLICSALNLAFTFALNAGMARGVIDGRLTTFIFVARAFGSSVVYAGGWGVLIWLAVRSRGVSSKSEPAEAVARTDA
ncbi:MAG: hypothetical protein JXR94_11770 [Candidatus Hydrogenedentes bacterium]|nr:hypothetical protein [Candidatus Hydrogenedentota bacterium]